MLGIFEVIFYCLAVIIGVGSIAMATRQRDPEWLAMWVFALFAFVAGTVFREIGDQNIDRQERNDTIEAEYEIEILDINNDLKTGDIQYIEDNVVCNAVYLVIDDEYKLVEETIDCYDGVN